MRRVWRAACGGRAHADGRGGCEIEGDARSTPARVGRSAVTVRGSTVGDGRQLLERGCTRVLGAGPGVPTGQPVVETLIPDRLLLLAVSASAPCTLASTQLLIAVLGRTVSTRAAEGIETARI